MHLALSSPSISRKCHESVMKASWVVLQKLPMERNEREGSP